jgi:hypothetical protein
MTLEINLTRWNVESLAATLCDCPTPEPGCQRHMLWSLVSGSTFCDCPTPEPGCQAAYVVVIGLRFFVLVLAEAASGYYTESLTIVGDVCGENHIVAITKLYNMLTTAPHYFVNS